MASSTGRQPSRLEPEPAWSVLTDAPLKGLALAREAGTVLAWDERDQLYLLDLLGQHRSMGLAPGRITAGTISDDGSLIALLGEGNRLWLFGADLESISDRQAPPESSTLAIDPHGRFVAVGSRLSVTQFFTRQGRQAGRFETMQALAHIAFVPARPFLVAAATYGMLVGVELGPGGDSGKLDAEVVWQESVLSNVGRLATTGDGGMILASCFTHGVQRFDLRGQNEGAYHLGGTVAQAVPDFAGRLFAVSTVEGELAVLGPAGNIRWKTTLNRPVLSLETDPLGRYLIYGHATGEIVRLDLYPSERPESSRPAPSQSVAIRGGGAVRAPDWTAVVATTDERAETAVLTVLDDPPRIGLFTNSNHLQVFTADGQNLGQAPDILGMGRILRSSPGWIAAATDRAIVLFDARRNTAQRIDLSLVEVTHLAARPDTFGFAIVQERDRVGRATLAGRWVWKQALPSPVEELAIGPDGYSAVTTNDGLLRIFDPAGTPTELPVSVAGDPLCLIEAPEGSPSTVTWITLARRAQVLRGHDRRGRVIWEAPIPWEGWQLLRLGAIALISAPDGRALAFDGAGHLRAQGRSSESANDVFGATPQGDAWRISRQGIHLICTDLSGRVRWRAVVDGPLGPLAVGASGTATLIGRSLAWFGNADT